MFHDDLIGAQLQGFERLLIIKAQFVVLMTKQETLSACVRLSVEKDGGGEKGQREEGRGTQK